MPNNNLIKHLRGNTYLDILSYNGLQNENSDLSSSLDKLSSIYEKLFEIGLTLSAFQFIGLVLESSLSNNEFYVQVAYFLLCIGFLMSLFGSLISFVAFEYFSSIYEETNEFIIKGIQKYKCIFRLAEIFLYLDSGLFILPINLLIYRVLDYPYGIFFNIFSFILTILGILLHYKVIVRRQMYDENTQRLIYDKTL